MIGKLSESKNVQWFSLNYKGGLSILFIIKLFWITSYCWYLEVSSIKQFLSLPAYLYFSSQRIIFIFHYWAESCLSAISYSVVRLRFSTWSRGTYYASHVIYLQAIKPITIKYLTVIHGIYIYIYIVST